MPGSIVDFHDDAASTSPSGTAKTRVVLVVRLSPAVDTLNMPNMVLYGSDETLRNSPHCCLVPAFSYIALIVVRLQAPSSCLVQLNKRTAFLKQELPGRSMMRLPTILECWGVMGNVVGILYSKPAYSQEGRRRSLVCGGCWQHDCQWWDTWFTLGKFCLNSIWSKLATSFCWKRQLYIKSKLPAHHTFCSHFYDSS